ncbi:MAG: M23 family metallopeptidase, partial [Chloroflexota bacterium]
MRFVKTKIWLPALFVLGLAAGASGWLERAGTAFARALDRPFAAVQPFLYPPYPGTASEESLFDHTSPYYTDSDKKMVVFTGDEANKNCPVPRPPGTPPPQRNVCDAGWGIYWSYSLGDWLAYNGHDGTDYGLSYRPLYAAADSDEVVYAGWNDPQNHSYGLGLYVKLQHANGYYTTYGHMSAVAVQTCGFSGCQSVDRGEMIGISGNTGNSTGPHLHFKVSDPLNRPVDPYGWAGAPGQDPLPHNQRESLWAQNPSVIVYSGEPVLPSGQALDYPPPVTGGTIVDDTDIRFDETP